jgi:hypothetical protein
MQEMLDRGGLTAVKTTELEALKQGATARTVISEGLSDYQALVNISVPVRTRDGKKTDKNEVAVQGSRVKLDEEEAENLMRFGEGTGRQRPAIRPWSESGQPLPRLLPVQLSGKIRQPPPPPKGTDLPRPDPAGSSHVLNMLPPEASDPHTEGQSELNPETMDIPPSGRGGGALPQ